MELVWKEEREEFPCHFTGLICLTVATVYRWLFLALVHRFTDLGGSSQNIAFILTSLQKATCGLI